jgi:hypothetical protein
MLEVQEPRGRGNEHLRVVGVVGRFTCQQAGR